MRRVVIICFLFCQSLGAIECDAGVPNISARALDKSQTFTVFTDFIVWSAKESGADNWGQVFKTSAALPEKMDIDILELSFGWDVGFRVGIDYGMKHDRWDTKLYYTWFRTEGNDHASAPDGQITSPYLGNFYVDNTDGSGDGPSYRSARIRWTILFNVFDWELGRNYWVSSALSLRPFIGLRGGWIHQKIHSKWLNPVPSNTVTNPGAFGISRENLKNNFWGVGPSAGLNTKWKLGTLSTHVFSLFGDFSAALLYGHWTFKDVYTNEIPTKVTTHLSHINGGATTLRSFTGFGWDTLFNKGRFHFSMRLGYEAQFWLDQLQFYTFNTGRLVNALTLQGGSLDLRFDF